MSRQVGNRHPETSSRTVARACSFSDRVQVAKALGEELGVFVGVEKGVYRVLGGYTATDPDGVRRLVKRLKP